MRIGKELLKCAGYFIVMYIVITILIPVQYRGPLLKISGYVLAAAFLVNIIRMIFGADSGSGFFSSFFRWLSSLIICIYAISFLCYLTIDGFRELVNRFLGG